MCGRYCQTFFANWYCQVFFAVRPCGQNPGQGTVRSVLIFVCIVFDRAQAVKRQLDALLSIPDQIVVQNRYKLLCSDPLPGTVVEHLVF